MTKPWIKDAEVRRRVPPGRELPARFDAFVRAEPPFRVEWNDLDSYSLKPSATTEAVPFLRLPDGALVALWYHAPAPAVVLIGGHGELKVLARDFDDILRALAARKSGVPDFDESDTPFVVPGTTGKPGTDDLPALQERFELWVAVHTALLPPLQSPATEALRERVYRIAEAMIHGGLSKVYTLASCWWSMNFRAERRGRELSVAYLDYGQWYPVPDEYEMSAAVAELLELVQDKGRDCYEFVVLCQGLVSVDHDRQLLLTPPTPATEAS